MSLKEWNDVRSRLSFREFLSMKFGNFISSSNEINIFYPLKGEQKVFAVIKKGSHSSELFEYLAGEDKFVIFSHYDEDVIWYKTFPKNIIEFQTKTGFILMKIYLIYKRVLKMRLISHTHIVLI